MARLLSLIVALSCLLLSMPSTVMGFTLEPEVLIIDSVVPGTEESTTLAVTNTGQEDLECTVSLSDSVDWVSLAPRDFSLPPGETGNIVIVASPPYPSSGGTRTLVVSVECNGQEKNATLLVEVLGSETTTVRVGSFVVEDFEEDTGSTVTLSLENAGETDSTSRVVITVFSGGTKVLESDEIVSTAPGETVNVTLPVAPGELSIGEYVAQALVLSSGEIVYSQEKSFRVLPAGALSIRGELVDGTTIATGTPGSNATVYGVFRNTGSRPVNATLHVLLDCGISRSELEGYTVETSPGDTVISRVLLSLPDYPVNCSMTYWFSFADRETEKRSGVVRVATAEPEKEKKSLVVYAMLLFVLVAGASFYAWYGSGKPSPGATIKRRSLGKLGLSSRLEELLDRIDTAIARMKYKRKLGRKRWGC